MIENKLEIVKLEKSHEDEDTALTGRVEWDDSPVKASNGRPTDLCYTLQCPDVFIYIKQMGIKTKLAFDAIMRKENMNTTTQVNYGLAKQVEPNNLVKTMEMLSNNGYKHIALCVPTIQHIIANSSGVVENLSNLGKDFKFRKTYAQIDFNNARFYCFAHQNNQHILRLRGPQFDAAIVRGYPSTEFNDMLTLGLRIDSNPILVRVEN